MKKTIDDYMKMSYRMELIKDPYDGGYVLCFPELVGCMTCAETLEKVLLNAEDAKLCWLEAELEEGHKIPKPQLEDGLSDIFKVLIPKRLRVKLLKLSEVKRMSLQDYCVGVLSEHIKKENNNKNIDDINRNIQTLSKLINEGYKGGELLDKFSREISDEMDNIENTKTRTVAQKKPDGFV